MGDKSKTLPTQPDSPTWPHVLAFAQAMEAKLAKNRHKGDRKGWLAMEPAALLARLKDEVAELEEALSSDPPDVAEVRGETSDVANFAMMIADRSGALQAAALGVDGATTTVEVSE